MLLRNVTETQYSKSNFVLGTQQSELLLVQLLLYLFFFQGASSNS